MTRPVGMKRIILLGIVAILGIMVIALDFVVAFGLSFTGPGHYSWALVVLIVVATLLDLPAMVISFVRPKLGAALVLAGVIAFAVYQICFFVHFREVPTAKVTMQFACFLAPKLLIAWLMLKIFRREQDALPAASSISRI